MDAIFTEKIMIRAIFLKTAFLSLLLNISVSIGMEYIPLKITRQTAHTNRRERP